ncbi:golgin subfamily A member 4-like isoform X2 [Gordionus sp. m RMFG-2023]|uniref:golgin subfamily A member 4-like isoform X2 n=1 Tax=Gordionus sp. m RMFG-2023 TaxID=3053472 RepID=UPI0031FC29E7
MFKNLKKKLEESGELIPNQPQLIEPLDNIEISQLISKEQRKSDVLTNNRPSRSNNAISTIPLNSKIENNTFQSNVPRPTRNDCQLSPTLASSSPMVDVDLSFSPISNKAKITSPRFMPQSDIESEGGSEMGEEMAVQDFANIDVFSKEQLFYKVKRVLTQLTKYRGRYSEVTHAYKVLEKEREKMQNALLQFQDKSLRKIHEMKETCQLTQQAKAHMEYSYRLLLEEKEEQINVLKTQVQYFKENKYNGTDEISPHQESSIVISSQNHSDQTTEMTDIENTGKPSEPFSHYLLDSEQLPTRSADFQTYKETFSVGFLTEEIEKSPVSGGDEKELREALEMALDRLRDTHKRLQETEKKLGERDGKTLTHIQGGALSLTDDSVIKDRTSLRVIELESECSELRESLQYLEHEFVIKVNEAQELEENLGIPQDNENDDQKNETNNTQDNWNWSAPNIENISINDRERGKIDLKNKLEITEGKLAKIKHDKSLMEQEFEERFRASEIRYLECAKVSQDDITAREAVNFFLSSEMNKIRSELEDVLRSKCQLEDQISLLKSEIEPTKANLHKHEKIVAEFQANHINYKTMADDYANIQKDLERLRNELDEKYRELEIIKTERSRDNDKIKALESKHLSSASDKDFLIKNLSNELASLKSVLEEDGRLKSEAELTIYQLKLELLRANTVLKENSASDKDSLIKDLSNELLSLKSSLEENVKLKSVAEETMSQLELLRANTESRENLPSGKDSLIKDLSNELSNLKSALEENLKLKSVTEQAMSQLNLELLRTNTELLENTALIQEMKVRVEEYDSLQIMFDDLSLQYREKCEELSSIKYQVNQDHEKFETLDRKYQEHVLESQNAMAAKEAHVQSLTLKSEELEISLEHAIMETKCLALKEDMIKALKEDLLFNETLADEARYELEDLRFKYHEKCREIENLTIESIRFKDDEVASVRDSILDQKYQETQTDLEIFPDFTASIEETVDSPINERKEKHFLTKIAELEMELGLKESFSNEVESKLVEFRRQLGDRQLALAHSLVHCFDDKANFEKSPTLSPMHEEVQTPIDQMYSILHDSDLKMKHTIDLYDQKLEEREKEIAVLKNRMRHKAEQLRNLEKKLVFYLEQTFKTAVSQFGSSLLASLSQRGLLPETKAEKNIIDHDIWPVDIEKYLWSGPITHILNETLTDEFFDHLTSLHPISKRNNSSIQSTNLKKASQDMDEIGLDFNDNSRIWSQDTMAVGYRDIPPTEAIDQENILKDYSSAVSFTLSQYNDFPLNSTMIRDNKRSSSVASSTFNSSSCCYGPPPLFPETSELEYLRKIIYEYIMGHEPLTMLKVISAILKFPDDKRLKIIEKEKSKNSSYNRWY